MYRERRLAAANAGQKFPTFRIALAQLDDAKQMAEAMGVVDVVAFWDRVFQYVEPKRKQPRRKLDKKISHP
jgi:hypothetical protein